MRNGARASAMLAYTHLRRPALRALFQPGRARAEPRLRRHAHRQSGAWRLPHARRLPRLLAVHALRHQPGPASRSPSCCSLLVGLAALLPAGAAAARGARPGNAVDHPVLRPLAGDRGAGHHRLRHQRALHSRRRTRPACMGRRPLRRQLRKRPGDASRPDPFRRPGWRAASRARSPCCSSISISIAPGSAP